MDRIGNSINKNKKPEADWTLIDEFSKIREAFYSKQI